ncbi:hypothetical protein A2U01_0061242, partial [Trifolium medium]|nr:hypothetical protein [Trifolium medium]
MLRLMNPFLEEIKECQKTDERLMKKLVLITVPARGAARRRQNLNVASKQAWRAAQHPWAQ